MKRGPHKIKTKARNANNKRNRLFGIIFPIIADQSPLLLNELAAVATKTHK